MAVNFLTCQRLGTTRFKFHWINEARSVASVPRTSAGSVSTPLGTPSELNGEQREDTILLLFEGLSHSNDELRLEEVSASECSIRVL